MYSHSSQLCIILFAGYAPGDVSTLQFSSAGIADHIVASGLSLLSGQLYYMSVKGMLLFFLYYFFLCFKMFLNR